MVCNVEMASDHLIVHPPNIIEGIQYKSSRNISSHNASVTSSQGVLELGEVGDRGKTTIWGEIEKVTDIRHREFYSELNSNTTFILVIISSKPCREFLKIKTNPELLPPHVIVVCHENYQQYAGAFARRSLFKPSIGNCFHKVAKK